MKYICTEQKEGKQEIFVFPKSVDHDVMTEALGFMKNQTHDTQKRVIRIPISAGFVSKLGICFGKSHTLNLDSRPDEDTALIAKQFEQ